MSSNADIRAAIKQTRMTLDASIQTDVALKILQQLKTLPSFSAANKIACYLSYNGEVPTKPIIDEIWQQNKNCYLPVLNTVPEKHLTFHEYSQQTILQPNKYNIDEPINTHEIDITNLDIVLVPLVAFDEHCNRLGMGAGFYDRTFAFRKQQNIPLLIGLAYEMQKSNSLTINDWDIPMDLVVTEKQIYSFS